MPLALGILATVWAGILCDAVLETSLRESPYWLPGPGILIGVLVMWCCVLLLVGLTGKIRIALAVLLPLSLLIGAANWTRMSILGEPVVPADIDFLRHPGFLIEMVDTSKVVLGVVVAAGVALAVLRLGNVVSRRYAPLATGHPGRRSWLALRVLLVLVTSLALLQTGTFNRPGNVWRAMYDATGLEWASWGQVENYQKNGFIGGFLYNLPTEAMKEPGGYGPTVMQEIAERYARRAASYNRHADRAALGTYNIVMVLSESFGDINKVDGIKLVADAIPNTRATSRREWGGQALTAFYGNGTSTMEFQSLTGQADALFEPQMTTPYQQLVPDMNSYPSAVGWLNGLGYQSIAIHAFTTELYHRNEVYKTFGFDDFIHDTTMQEKQHLQDNPFISDKSAYDEVLHQINTHDSPVFAHVVTMQNHGPTSDWYDDPFDVNGVSGDEAKSIGGYARGLHYTDADLPGFLDSLRATKEPTILVFYGDHFPGIFGTSTRSANSDLALRTTPMFIWSSEGGQPVQLPATNPIDFLPLAMQRMGAPLPPYYELLREVSTQIGALDRTGAVSAHGDVLPYSSLTQRQQLLLNDFRMVQYDFSLGHRYALPEMWYSPSN